MESSHDAPPPEVVAAMRDPAKQLRDRYWLVAELGAGGMGKVYRAWDEPLGRWVAVKFVRDPGDERAREYFLREARVAAQLNHPNVAAIYEVGQDHHGRVFIAMQYIEGEELSAKLARSLGQTEVVRLMTAVARAVDAAHRIGVIHRDLKPANLVRDREGRVFVLDFGLAKQLRNDGSRSGLTQSGAIMGTPLYMAPEQAGGEPENVDAVSDVYGLGACLYDLLGGRPPHRGRTQTELLVNIIRDEPVRLGKVNPRVPRDLETIVAKCLEKEKDRRYASAAALADDLDRFTRGEPIEARPASLVYRARMRVKRDKRFAAALAAVVVVIALAAVAVSFAGRRAEERAADAERRAASAEQRAEVEELVARARRLYEEGDLEQAHAVARRVQELAPDLAAGAYWEARCRVSLYARAQRLPDTWLSSGAVHFLPAPPEGEQARAHRERAIELVERIGADAADVGAWEVTLVRGAVAVLRGDYAEGERLLAGVLERADRARELEARYYLGVARYYQGRFGEAAEADEAVLRVPGWIALVVRAQQAAALDDRLHGRSARALERYERALALAGALAVVDEERSALLAAGVLTARGSLRRELGNYDAALADLEDAVARAARVVASDDRERRVRAFTRRADARRAIAAWRADRRTRADAAEAAREAIADLDAALELDPRHAPARLARGLARAELAELTAAPAEAYAPALEDLDAVDEIVRTPEGRLRRLFIAAGARGSQAIVEGLDALLEQFPDHVPLRIERASMNATWAEQMWDRDGLDPAARFEEALRDADLAIEAAPDRPEAWFARAKVYSARADWKMIRQVADPTEDYERVFADIERALALNPEFRDAYVRRSEKRLSLGVHKANTGQDPIPDLEAAIADAERAIELNPWIGGIHYTIASVCQNVATIRWQRGDRQGAIEAIDRALAACTEGLRFERPGTPPRREVGFVNFAKGRMLAAVGRTDEARAHVERAVTLLTAALGEAPGQGSHFREIFLARGQALCALGRHAEARADYVEAGRRGAPGEALVQQCRAHEGR